MDGSDPRLELVERFFSGTGPTYDFMVNFATFGIDRRWKRRILELIPPHSRRILDLACGTGISTFSIADRLPESEVVGVELREEYLRVAREKCEAWSGRNVTFVLSRAEDYRSDQPFDCITSSYLAKYADLPVLIRNSREMLKPGGTLLMHDFTFPPKGYLVAIWRAYFAVMRGLGRALFPAWNEIYRGLPRLIEESRWLEESEKALRREGFTGIEREYLTAYGSAIMRAQAPH